MDSLNIALLVFRVAVGATFFAHGYNHLFRGGKVEGTGRWFASLGMRPGIVHAWLASVVELAGGAMLVAGFLTPLAAASVTGTMVVAWMINHRTNGFFIFRPGEGWEYVMNLAVAGFALGVLGPGEWSLDELFGIDWTPTTRLAVTAIAGLGGAFALLAVFWRPGEPESSGSDDSGGGV